MKLNNLVPPCNELLNKRKDGKNFMAYKKYYENFKMENDNVTLEATCYSQGTSYGFHHCVEYIIVKDKRSNEVYTSGTRTFAQYYNRTWERYQFQSVIRRAFEKLRKEWNLKDDDPIVKATESLIAHYGGR